jgi:hypothetical protein
LRPRLMACLRFIAFAPVMEKTFRSRIAILSLRDWILARLERKGIGNCG